MATTTAGSAVRAARTYVPPAFPMDAVAGRKRLPTLCARADVTFATGWVAFLPALFPAMSAIIEVAIAAGVYGANLSGGGSSLIVLASAPFRPILRSMREAARSSGREGRGMILSADQRGGV